MMPVSVSMALIMVVVVVDDVDDVDYVNDIDDVGSDVVDDDTYDVDE